jgi:anthranilate synthase/aminodeoxychorismate synthase-like glutamine amidotransferase
VPSEVQVRTIIIDNYDSYTYNLFQLIAEVNDEEPVVFKNDELSWRELSRLKCDNMVISPGPGTPVNAADFGVCGDVLRNAAVPVLGVCLGHQGLVHVCGGTIGHAPEVMHGRISAVYHDASPLFARIPQGFRAVRYHSLVAVDPLPRVLKRTAWTEDGVTMAVEHVHRPQWGVQFHPESICTEFGARLLANFRDLTVSLGEGSRRPPPAIGARVGEGTC